MLDLSSQPGPDENVWYRADIGYMWTGPWSDTIIEALDGLHDELVRVGEIKYEKETNP